MEKLFDIKEEGDKKKDRKKNDKPKPEKRELKEEEKLNKPEGAISLEDYLKSKEKPKEEEKKEVKRIQDGKPLEKVKDKESDELGTTGAGKKKQRKKKEKGVNREEEDLNKEILSNLKISESNERPNREDRGEGFKGRGRGGKDKDDNEISLIDILENDERNIEDEIDLRIKIKKLLDKMKYILKGREKTIIELRFGLGRSKTKNTKPNSSNASEYLEAMYQG